MNEQLEIGFDYTAAEQAILSQLRRGRENAISMSDLASLVGLSTRELQTVIKCLVEDHGVMIASATGKNHGYFYPESEAEYQAAADQLIHRITSLAKRLRALNRTSYETIFGQGRLTV